MKRIFFYTICAVTPFLFGCADDGNNEETIDENSPAGIHGSVVVNGEPVNAAVILLTPGGGTKITGSDGMYDFSGLQPGRYELKVYKEGLQSSNKGIELKPGKDEELVITLTQSAGKLSLNKAYIDMGSNASNNAAGFSILNNSDSELSWSITNAAGWITLKTPKSGKINAGKAEAVVFTIDRGKLNENTGDNHATLVVRSTSTDDGSIAELLVTVFGTGDGTNITIGSDGDEYVLIGDLYVQTKDIGGTVDWISANSLCNNSVVGGYNDWRLPTINELATIYSNKEVIGGFNGNYYWSSTVNTTYYYYMDFSNGAQAMESISGSNNVRAVRRDMPPSVSILPISNISESSITLNGLMTNAGNPTYTERGFVYATSHSPTVNNTKVVSYTAKSSDAFSETVSGLTKGVTYYVRAYAVNSVETAYSDEISVSVTNQKAQVSTLPVTDITETSVVLNGSINSKGIPAYTEKGFVYSTAFQNPTVEDNDKKTVTGTGTGEYSANLSGLTTGTTYYVRAYATNSEGTAYGASVSFIPQSASYVVLTAAGIMVQKADISESYLNWTSAKTLCESSTVGGYSDWRLPTLSELATMYNERNTIGGFKTDSYSYHYWSSTVVPAKSNYYYQIQFSTGATAEGYKNDSYYNSYYTSHSYYARAVRTLP